MRADTLEIIWREEYKGFGEDMGGGCWSVHRADLHSRLKELVEAQELQGDVDVKNVKKGCGKVVDGGPVRIDLGRAVVGVDCEAGVIEFHDGTKLEGWDLIVIADGAHVCLFFPISRSNFVPPLLFHCVPFGIHSRTPASPSIHDTGSPPLTDPSL